MGAAAAAEAAAESLAVAAIAATGSLGDAASARDTPLDAAAGDSLADSAASAILFCRRRAAFAAARV